MTPAARARQVWTIAKLQLGRVFFSRRSLWVYLLAFFPSVIFIGHGLEVKFRRERWSSRITPTAVLETFREGDQEADVMKRAGQPVNDFERRRRRHRNDGDNEPARRYVMFFDGHSRWNLNFEEGVLQNINSEPIISLDNDRKAFAAVFQYFYLRLAIFFGCLGIFMNLFRGEMLDKTLHYWFLAPARREVLLAGKYVAGLIAASLIFGLGAIVAYSAMMWPQIPAEADAFWRTQGASHMVSYALAATLGCVGYGSVFLAAGLLLRNPIIPAVILLLWESINGILPAMLQKLSVLYYVQSLTPVPAPTDASAPMLIQLLMSPAEPPAPAVAVMGLLAVTLLVLWAAAKAANRLEINYGTD